MTKDVDCTIRWLGRSGASSLSLQFAQLLTHLLAEDQLVLHAVEFYTSPLRFDEAPASLLTAFAAADLVLFKGDANYRRLLGNTNAYTRLAYPMTPTRLIIYA
jgi:hypothetical protein